MSAEILRQAAALMRERAETATPGPWHQGRTQDGEVLADGTGYIGEYEPNGEVLAFDADGYVTLEFGAGRHQDAEHIASWHPAVALAVADWLDVQAQKCEEIEAFDRAYGYEPDEGILAARANDVAPALTVARAYLGGDE